MNLVDYLVTHALAKDPFEARGLILAGKVLVNNQPITKEKTLVKPGDVIRIRAKRHYVARSAYKLAPLIERWQFPVANCDLADIGSATGGFTEVLLEAGAARVLCVDVGYGILAEKLRRHPKVFVLERTNILKLTQERLPFLPQHFTVDVSFVSLRKILPKIEELRRAAPTAALLLFKPQFEIPRNQVFLLEKGVLKDSQKAHTLLEDFINFAKSANWKVLQVAPAPLKGQKGNQEYFLYLEKS